MKRRQKIDWSRAEVQRDLRALTSTEFCIKYGVSIATVSIYRRRAGLTRPHAAKIAPPRGLADETRRFPVEQIARRHRVSTGTVRAWMHEIGVRPWDAWAQRRKRKAAPVVRRILKLREKGLRHQDIANALGVSYATVANTIRARGLQGKHQTPVNLNRASAMLVLRAAGFTLEQIGTAFALTRERVRQVLRDAPRQAKLALKGGARG